MIEKLKKIKECIATMMDTLPNPAVALVTQKTERKIKHETADVDKNGTEEKL